MPHPSPLRPAIVLAGMQTLFLLMLGVDLVRHETTQALFQESGAIESMAALAFFIAAGLFWVLRPDPMLRIQWQLPVILVLMGLRELDFDKRLTSEGILKLRLYTGPSPWFEKLAGAVVVALILWCGWRLLRYTLPAFWRGLLAAHPASWLSLGAAAAIVIAKSLDGIGRKLGAFGASLDPKTLTAAVRAEEILEVLAAMMLVMAVAYYSQRRHKQP